MTAFEDCKRSGEREEHVRFAKQFIDENNIEYVYLQFVSLTGRLVGKGIPAKHFGRVMTNGVTTVLGATVNVATDRQGNYLGYPPNASQLIALPEPETLVQLPWAPNVARVFCTLFCNLDDTDPGSPLAADSRGVLRRANDWFEEQTGYRIRIGMEPEMMWLKNDPSQSGLVGASSPFCYHIDQFEELRPVLLKVLSYAEKMGLDMIQGDHEDAPGQLELNFSYDDALASCDRLLTYRQICRQVAREHDLVACFLPKPFVGVSASSCHFNLSLWRGGERTELESAFPKQYGSPAVYHHHRGGTNVTSSESFHSGLCDVSKNAIGGILSHIDALTAFAASTVNSYRRLWDTGFWAPTLANWGYQNRTCAVRVPTNDRIEYRTADSIVNPYLMACGLTYAIEDGISEKLDPGKPTGEDSYADQNNVVPEIPKTLEGSLEALRLDDVIRNGMGAEMYRVFDEHKRDEWARFMAEVTSWDFENYMAFTP